MIIRKLKNYWKKFFIIQSVVIILLSVVGLPNNIEGMYWWMGITFVDMVTTHPIWYEEEENKQ